VDQTTDNVELLPFAEIQAIFKKQMSLSYAYSAETESDQPLDYRRIIIEKIQLGYMRVQRQGRDGEYLMIPVWDFYGYEAMKFEDPVTAAQWVYFTLNADGEMEEREPYQSYLTVNAIDGSIIDRRMGY
jgi:hypothetical protein